jgi:methylated-DNA-[protein]-cysteine S-methyltransferase
MHVKLAYHVMSAPAPLGLIFLAVTERGLRYVEFMDRKSIKRVIASHEADAPGATWEASLLTLKPVVDQFEAYFCGARTRFEIPLDPVGSEFQRATWNALRAIPYGETRTYGDIARAIGQPRAARAIGLANHDNPIAIIVPCHRVIGADGSLTGYGGGLPRKRWLLRHEERFALPEVDTPRRLTAVQQTLRLTAAAPKQGARAGVAMVTARAGGRPAAATLRSPGAAAATRPGGRGAGAASPRNGHGVSITPPRTDARVIARPAAAIARRASGAAATRPQRKVARAAPPARGGGKRAQAGRTTTRTGQRQAR